MSKESYYDRHIARIQGLLRDQTKLLQEIVDILKTPLPGIGDTYCPPKKFKENLTQIKWNKISPAIKGEKIIHRDLKLKHWGEGPWLDEPDRFRFEHRGIECEMLRVHAPDGMNSEYLFGGHWCGYIKLPYKDCISEEQIENFSVHGGITFNDLKEDDNHWIGFDCSHHNDITPSIILYMKREGMRSAEFLSEPHCTYRDAEYVMAEVKSMADQLVELMKRKSNG